MTAGERRCRNCGCTEENGCILVDPNTEEEYSCEWVTRGIRVGSLCTGCERYASRTRLRGPLLREVVCANPKCGKSFRPTFQRGRRPIGCDEVCSHQATLARKRTRESKNRRDQGRGIVVDFTCACGLFLRYRLQAERHKAGCRFQRDQLPLALPPPRVG